MSGLNALPCQVLSVLDLFKQCKLCAVSIPSVNKINLLIFQILCYAVTHLQTRMSISVNLRIEILLLKGISVDVLDTFLYHY